MTLARWRNTRDMYNLQDRMNRLFDGFFNVDSDDSSDLTSTWLPLTNIYETKDTYLIRVDVPGLKKEDIHIEFKDGAIVFSGERKYDDTFKNEETTRIEVAYGKFYRSFLLPSAVNQDKIKANLKDGVLEVRIQKAEEAKPKSIKITSD